jgi:hypothetical protein
MLATTPKVCEQIQAAAQALEWRLSPGDGADDQERYLTSANQRRMLHGGHILAQLAESVTEYGLDHAEDLALVLAARKQLAAITADAPVDVVTRAAAAVGHVDEALRGLGIVPPFPVQAEDLRCPLCGDERALKSS